MKALLRLAGVLVLAWGMALPARAIGLLIVDEPAGDAAQGAIGRPIHRYTPLEIRSAKVAATIRDQVAATKIEEEFYNPNGARLEGTFYLPLPKGAHLQKFALEVNGRMTDAELLTADRAKGIYEEIVRKARDPALLEYLGRDLVKVRIFPIEPHRTKKVEVSYTQLLESDAGLVSYVLPLNAAKYCAAPVKNLAVRIDLESARPLQTIYSPSHPAEIRRTSEKTAVIGLESSGVRPDRDFQLLFSAARGELGFSLLTHRKAGEDGYFMLLATPAVTGEKPAAKDVIFVMDTSGSMAGAKIDQARKALLFCIENLNADDRFDLIRFSTEAEPLFNKLTEATEAARKQASEFARNLKAAGGTAIDGALRAALGLLPGRSDRPCYLVFVTDGLPTIGVTAEDPIVAHVKAAAGSARVFCFGVGTDVNTRLLDRLAEETGAVSQYVLPDEDLEVKLSAFFEKISDPVLAEVELDFGTARANRLHPGRLPDLFKGRQAVAFGRYRAGGATTVTLKGKIGGRGKSFAYPVEFPEENAAHDFIPRLWATRRAGHLLEEIRLHGENAELKEEVTALAKQYGIVTPYTSFLVTEDAPVPAPPAHAAGDPLVFHRSNPETVRRHFPQLAVAAPGGAAPTTVVRDQNSGDLAVAGARYSLKLKEAASEAEAQGAPAEVRQYLATGRLGSAPKDESPALKKERFVGQRTFRYDGSAWVELAATTLRQEGAVRIEFDSPEYWRFAAEHPDLNDVLALGTEVRFLLDGKLHEVFSRKK